MRVPTATIEASMQTKRPLLCDLEDSATHEGMVPGKERINRGEFLSTQVPSRREWMKRLVKERTCIRAISESLIRGNYQTRRVRVSSDRRVAREKRLNEQ